MFCQLLHFFKGFIRLHPGLENPETNEDAWMGPQQSPYRGVQLGLFLQNHIEHMSVGWLQSLVR